mmetsp:Transcript_26025/g.32083  ORF Transcript_26025/g.32083 Transcript_26025/m.32083 type:complete len:360 (-) Transcript_26025:255-1334(-)
MALQESDSPPRILPPSWAVAARGEARLEPVSESSYLQSPVDLTSQAVFRIGRSQNSELQLLHCTSSRRHALLFHHPNGSCYIVDCGSAHGTYINGVRVNTQESSNGVILPHRVKKGAMIRFGGPGAPLFILKSFSVRFDSLVQNLEETRTLLKDVVSEDDNDQCLPMFSKVEKSSNYSFDALVSLNTRLNAVSSSNRSLNPKYPLLSLSSQCLEAQLHPSSHSFLKKRSTVSFDDDIDMELIHCHKKLKVFENHNNQTLQETDLSQNIAIVSPARQKPVLHFDFDNLERAVVSPTPLEENNLLIKPKDNLNVKGILSIPISFSSHSKKMKRVAFSEEPPEEFYPSSVTPDSSSDCEGEP